MTKYNSGMVRISNGLVAVIHDIAKKEDRSVRSVADRLIAAGLVAEKKNSRRRA